MRILTWNLWWRFGDWRQRHDAIRDLLLREQPDVIGLQEVWTDEGHDQAHELAGHLGMECAVAVAPDAQRWQSRTRDRVVGVGNAVLSRWPITEVDVVGLPAAPGRGVERTLLLTTIEAPSAALVFATTHLHSDVDGGAVRRQQAAVISDRLRQTPAERTVVLTGDLNADPGSAEVRHLLAAPEGAAAGRSFVDAWAAGDSVGDGWTWAVSNPHAAAHGPVSARVDYVLVSRAVTAPEARLRARLSGEEPVAGVWPSDHCALVVDLAV